MTITEFYPLSLHDALPIFNPNPADKPSSRVVFRLDVQHYAPHFSQEFLSHKLKVIVLFLKVSIEHDHLREPEDRKSTRLNSSHMSISYAVFCLQKKIIINS